MKYITVGGVEAPDGRAMWLEVGDVGVIVHRHAESAFEVEFITGEGGTVAVVTLRSEDLRLIDAHEILHVRSLAGG